MEQPQLPLSFSWVPRCVLFSRPAEEQGRPREFLGVVLWHLRAAKLAVPEAAANILFFFSSRAAAPPATTGARARFLIQCTQADITGGAGTITSSCSPAKGRVYRTGDIAAASPRAGAAQPLLHPTFLPSLPPEIPNRAQASLFCLKQEAGFFYEHPKYLLKSTDLKIKHWGRNAWECL